MPRSSSFSVGRKSPGLTHQHGFLASVVRFWHKSYAADYLGLALLLTAYTLSKRFIEPFHRMFSLDNLAIQYPHADPERVPPSWLFAFAGGIPLFVIGVSLALSRPGIHKVHVTFLGLVISLILTSFLTDVVKNSVGRPRPDLLARCKPVSVVQIAEDLKALIRVRVLTGNQEKGTPDHRLITFEVCTETDHHLLHDGWRSFPSGHSSCAFSGLGYLALFLAGQMHVWRPQTDLARVLIALAPLLGAALIAISRCEDYRHDVYDVTAGSLLGMSIANFSYRRYYPRLRSIQCETPFPSRADSAFTNGFSKVKDDEERIRSANDFVIDDLEDDPEAVPLRDVDRNSDRDLERGSR